MATYLLKFGGQTIGTELIYDLPSGERLTAPLEEQGLDRDSALLVSVGTNLIWRLRFIVFHEEADMFIFSKWLIAVARMMRRSRQDVTVYSDSTLKITYPQCAFVGFQRPQPKSVAEARFAAELAFDFVTDQEPY